MICNGCGGVVGRDCFNPSECEWITRDMQARQQAEEFTAPLLARIAELEAQLAQRPEERAPLLAEWISPEPTQEMIDAVSTILQPYAAKLVWARMLKVALIPPAHYERGR